MYQLYAQLDCFESRELAHYFFILSTWEKWSSLYMCELNSWANANETDRSTKKIVQLRIAFYRLCSVWAHKWHIRPCMRWVLHWPLVWPFTVSLCRDRTMNNTAINNVRRRHHETVPHVATDNDGKHYCTTNKIRIMSKRKCIYLLGEMKRMICVAFVWRAYHPLTDER